MTFSNIVDKYEPYRRSVPLRCTQEQKCQDLQTAAKNVFLWHAPTSGFGSDSKGVDGRTLLLPLPNKSIDLKVHKIEIFFGFDFEICIISLLVMTKY